MSLWNNNWNDVIDVTPQRKSHKGADNWTISPEMEPNFIPPLAWAEEAFRKVSAYRGHGKIQGLHQITHEDLSAVSV